MVKIVVTGAAGKMGGRILANAAKDKSIQLAGAIDVSGNPMLGKDAGLAAGCGPLGLKITDNLEGARRLADVLIDFSHASATLSNLEIVSRLKKSAVIGTTGHAPDQKKEIEKRGRDLPLVFAPNMSVMVNLMWKLLEQVEKTLGEGVAVQISETHHIHKKDKPSGTALEIQKVLQTMNITKMESKREGEVVGDHTVLFESPEEELVITHRAKSRDVFAVGALRAAKWVAGKPKGLYSMKDVLGL